MAKYDLEHVMQFCKEVGFEVISEEYVNASTAMEFRCPEGHVSRKTYSSLRRSPTCTACLHQRYRRPFSEVKSEVEVEGFKLLSTSEDYINNKTPLLIECPNGHEFTRSYQGWTRMSKRCTRPECGGKHVWTRDEVEAYIIAEGYELLSESYQNVFTSLLMRCPEGHEFHMNFNHFFHMGNRCTVCANNQPLTERYMAEEFAKQGLKLELDYGTYQNKYSTLPFRCNQHPEDLQNTNWHLFTRCKFVCNMCRNEERQQQYLEKCREIFAEHGLTLTPDAEYIDTFTTLPFTCDKHPSTVQYATLRDVLSGHQQCYSCWIESISGANSHRWQGGITALSHYLRGKISDWKFASEESGGWKCALTGSRYYVVHHLYSFDLIVQDIIRELGIEVRDAVSQYTEDELNTMAAKCVEIHERHPLGQCIRTDLHDLFHNEYGWGSNTPEQFEEFKRRFQTGEFER